jgi:hypothetical protein
MGLRLKAAAALLATFCLQAGPAAAQYCDNLEGQNVQVAGAIDKMVDLSGVLFFRDRKTSCQFGLVLERSETGCRAGGQIEVTGKLIKNKFMPDTYDIDRGGKATPRTLTCK